MMMGPVMMSFMMVIMMMGGVSPHPISPIPSPGVRGLDLHGGSSAMTATILKLPIMGLLKADLEEEGEDRQQIQHSPAGMLIPRSIADQDMEPPPAPTIPNAISSTTPPTLSSSPSSTSPQSTASPTSTTQLSTEEVTLTPSLTSHKKNAAIGLAVGAIIVIIVLTFAVRKWRADVLDRETRRKETEPVGRVASNVGAAPSYSNIHYDVGNGQAPMGVIIVVREGAGRPNVGEIRGGNRTGRVDDGLPSYEEANRGR